MATYLVETIGRGPRVVLVHGSGGNAASAWNGVRELADRFTLVLPTRPGYPPNPPLERIDFEEQAVELEPLLEDGAHLVGHSYGGVISMLIAARAPERVRSLAVSEPPAFALAAGNPDVDRAVEGFEALFAARLDPAEHLRRFLRAVGVDIDLPDPMPAELEAIARASMAERSPAEAEIPVEALASAPFRKLVISGAHHPAFDAVCDVLEQRAGFERAVVPGRGHGIPRAGGYNERLCDFLSRSDTV